MVNVNEVTGIRYGIISANSLDPWVVDEIQMTGTDIRYKETLEELEKGIRSVCAGLMSSSAVNDLIDTANEYLDWYDDEPIHEFEIDGVEGRTTWLGGALLVFIRESPYTTKAKLCSPCVPNCGDLDNPSEDGEVCYDVPADWRYNEE